MTMTGTGKDTAIVFVTDKGFLVPSLVAALQIIDQPKVMAISDLFILLVDVEEALLQQLRDTFSPRGIQFLPLEASLFLPKAGTHFNQTHIPHTTLGRFAICDILPSTYENIAYIDGDVQILGDIFPLISHKVKHGHIATVSEAIWMCENDQGHFWPKHKAYLNDLGITHYQDYFNAGILLFRWDTWQTMAREAMTYFNENSLKCIYHDQSALNAVFLGKREVLSPAYNFISFYAGLGLNKEVDPKIVHFTGGSKPWYYPGMPWHGRFIEVYAKFLADYPFLAPYLKMKTQQEIDAMLALDKKVQFKSQLMMPWRQWLRRRKLRKYMKETKFAF
jgi:lipopolysaccharide biosynthesis glycosyltransferase